MLAPPSSTSAGRPDYRRLFPTNPLLGGQLTTNQRYGAWGFLPQGLQAQPVAPSRPAWPYRQFSPTLTRRARSVLLSCTKQRQTWPVAPPTTNKKSGFGSGVRHALLHVCQRRARAKQTIGRPLANRGSRSPSHGARPQSLSHLLQRASWILTRATGLCECCLLLAPCQ